MSDRQIGFQLKAEGAAATAADFDRVAEAQGRVGAAAERVGASQDRLAGAHARQARGAHEAATASEATSRAIGALTPQIGDLFSQISAGGAPVTAFIQQGLQLRDVFANDATALQGLKNIVTPATVSLGLLAATAAGVAVAYKLGSDEGGGYERAIVASGNAAGVTADQLADMARAGSAAAGTIHENAGAIATLTATGKVGAENIQQFGVTAVKSQRELGIEVATTAERFSDLAGDPLAATVKLNEKLNYLTVGTYEHIKSLADQGRQTEAASAAQQAYATAMETRADQLAASAGTIERAWRSVLDVVKDVGDAMLNIGRKDTIGDQLKAAQQRLAELQGPTPYKNATLGDAIRGAVGGDAELQRQIATQRTLIAGLSRQLLLQDNVATSAAAATAAVAARIRLDKEGERLAGKQAQLEDAIAKTRQDGITAGWTEEQIQKRIAALKEKYADKGAASAAKKDLEDQAKLLAQLSGLTATFSEDWERLGKAYARGGLSADQLVTAQAELLSQQPAMREAARVEKERSDNVVRSNDAALKEIAALEGQVRAQLQSNEAIGLGAQQVAELEAGRLRLAAAEKTGYAAALESARLYAGEYAAAYASAAAAARNQASALYELATAKKEGAALQVTAEAEKSRLEQATRTNGQIAQSLTDALMRGGKSGGDYIKGYLRSLFAKPFQVLLQPVANTMGSIATAMTPSGGGTEASSYLNTASSGYNVYAAGSSLYTVGAQYAAGTMSAANAAGTIYGNATAAAYGDGLSALLATNGAYGTAAGASSAAAGTAAAAEGASAAGAASGSSMMGSFAAAGPYALAAFAIANALGLFRTTRQVGGGLLGTVGDTIDIRSYDLMRKSGTLFSGPDYNYSTRDADASVVKAVSTSVAGMLESTRAQAAALGIGDNIRTFTAQLGTDVIHPDTGGTGIKLDGLNAAQAQAKVAESVAALSEQMALKALAGNSGTEALMRFAGGAIKGLLSGDVASGIRGAMSGVASPTNGMQFMRDGETAVQTLTRLSSSLATVNSASETLGETLLPASLASGDLASKLLDVAGGADAFNTAAGGYFDAIYSDSQKLGAAQDKLSGAFERMGLAVPANDAAYRSLVAAQDLSTDAGRRARVELMQLAPAFEQVAEQTRQVAEQARQQALAVATGLAARDSRGSQLMDLRARAEEAAAGVAEKIRTMLDAARGQGADVYLQADAAAKAMAQAQAGWVLLYQPLKGAALEMARVSANAEAMRGTLTSLYGSASTAQSIIEKSVARQRELLARDFVSGVSDQLLQLTDASAYAAEQLRREQEQRIADAQALGLTADQMSRIVALNTAQTAALEKQQVAWKDTAGQQLASWLNSQRLGATSSLDPTGKFATAQAQFGSLVTAARASGRADISTITSAADALLTNGQAMYGSTARYAALEQMTRQTLESLGAALNLKGFSPEEQRAEMQRQTQWLEKVVQRLEDSVRIAAAAATSNDTKQADIEDQLDEIRTLLRRIAA